MKNTILNNWGLKLLALFLAVVTWFYVVVELRKGAVEEGEALKRILPYSISSKKVPIKLNLIGKPQNGYTVDYGNISITPSEFIMVGPKSIIKKVSFVKTQPIDISEYTKTFVKDVSIVPPAKGLSIKDKFIEVAVPISKVEE